MSKDITVAQVGAGLVVGGCMGEGNAGTWESPHGAFGLRLDAVHCGSECTVMLRLLEGVRGPARIEPYALVQLALINCLMYAKQHAHVS